MALTTATPSRGFSGGLPRNSTCGMLEALMPPMHTAGTPSWPFSARTAKVCLSPSGPMTFLVFVLLQIDSQHIMIHSREQKSGRDVTRVWVEKMVPMPR